LEELLKDLLKDFSWWRDTLDIYIVSFVVYRLILLIKGTRAVQMLKGFAIILFFYFIAQELEFMTLHWILTNFLSSIILIIIVIFQHDIRRVLIRVGAVPFLSYSETVEETKLLEEVVKAASTLAKRKIGALIALERDTGLKTYVDIGTNLDAAVNKEIIQSIFLPNSPIHDGAIVIQEGRITAAGALFPLTSSYIFDKSLGTRHRAAIGLTEETDAVVIVVSEETGSMSLVEDGEILQDIDADEMKKELFKYFKVGDRKGLAFASK